MVEGKAAIYRILISHNYHKVQKTIISFFLWERVLIFFATRTSILLQIAESCAKSLWKRSVSQTEAEEEGKKEEQSTSKFNPILKSFFSSVGQAKLLN